MHKEVTSDQTRAADGLAALGVAQAARAINDGVFAAETYAEALLDRARELSDLKAFITIDEEAVATAAREADKARSAGASSPLLGVPLGVKDSTSQPACARHLASAI
ncbi:amidase family protein [Rhizobium laguerreae]|uniref:amidase family protein n=1 Tax=Rhizobium laguerreae TaxID=1076926 RepID=UPI0028C4224C|nr:amidase family protein [Rhizobium laguerreae]